MWKWKDELEQEVDKVGGEEIPMLLDDVGKEDFPVRNIIENFHCAIRTKTKLVKVETKRNERRTDVKGG